MVYNAFKIGINIIDTTIFQVANTSYPRNLTEDFATAATGEKKKLIKNSKDFFYILLSY